MALIVKLKDIDQYKNYWQKKKTVLGGGCFDVFHFGHLKYLQGAKSEGDFLIILLESDRFIKNKKKRKPIHIQRERAEILAAIKFVDLVILLPFFKNDQKYLKLVEKIKPQVIAVTEGDPQIKNKQRQASAIGAQLKVVSPFIKKFSSSKIIHHAGFFSD